MSFFVLVPGAGGAAWYWHRVVPLLQRAGHTAVAVDLPGDDPRAGLQDYADRVLDAAGHDLDVVLVAQSMGGFTAPLVCERREVSALVLVNAMVPVPGERAGEWWDAVGAVRAREEAAASGGYPSDFDPDTYFLHDVPPKVVASGADHQRDEAEIAFAQPCEFTGWPRDVRVLAGADDRLFPVDLQRRVARERLDVAAEMVPGGHLVALSRPETLVAALVADR